jgi:hypothetical protein
VVSSDTLSSKGVGFLAAEPSLGSGEASSSSMASELSSSLSLFFPLPPFFFDKTAVGEAPTVILYYYFRIFTSSRVHTPTFTTVYKSLSMKREIVFSRFWLTLNLRRCKSEVTLAFQDSLEVAIPLKIRLFLSFQIPQAPIVKISKN